MATFAASAVFRARRGVADSAAFASCAVFATLAGFAGSAAFAGLAGLTDFAGFAGSAAFFAFVDDLVATRAAGARIEAGAPETGAGFATFRRAGAEVAAPGVAGVVRFADFAAFATFTGFAGSAALAVAVAFAGSTDFADFAVFAAITGAGAFADSAGFFACADFTALPAVGAGATDSATGAACAVVSTDFAARRRGAGASATGDCATGAVTLAVFAAFLDFVEVPRARRRDGDPASVSSRASCQPGTRLGRSSSATPTKK